MNYFTDKARGNVMWQYCVWCTEVLDVVADEEVGAVLPVLPRDVPLAVHGGQPHPHPHTVRVPVVQLVQHTLVIERTPGVQPPVPGGPGAHPLLSSLMILSLTHKPSQHSAHKISRLDNLFYFCLLTSDMRLGWQLSRTEDNRVPEPQGSSFTWSVSWSRVNINDNLNLEFWSLHLYQDKLKAVITLWKLMMIICTHVLRTLAIANHDQGCCDNSWADWRLAITLPSCHDPAVWQWPGESWDQTGPSVAIIARPVKGKRCENKS